MGRSNGRHRASRLATGQGALIHADSLMVDSVRLHGAHSPQCRYFHILLQEYAVGVLTRWKLQDRLPEEVACAGGMLKTPTPLTYDRKFPKLAVISAERASSTFVDRYIFGGLWHPRAGLLVRQSFMPLCLCQFSHEYNSYWDGEERGGGT
jgi:hypothetical protein